MLLTAEHVVDEAVAAGGLLGLQQRGGLTDHGHIGGFEVQDAQRWRHWRHALHRKQPGQSKQQDVYLPDEHLPACRDSGSPKLLSFLCERCKPCCSCCT